MADKYEAIDALTGLAHHGILGMRWGVRRYQRPDGSLTPEGKRHLNREEKKELVRQHKERENTQISYLKSVSTVIEMDSLLKSGHKINVRDENTGLSKDVKALSESEIKDYENSAKMGLKELQKYTKSQNPKIAKIASKQYKTASRWFENAGRELRRKNRKAAAKAFGIMTVPTMATVGTIFLMNALGHSDTDTGYSAVDTSASLSHHGIIGMHWGVRRYQPYSKEQKKGKEVGEAALDRKEIRAIKKTANAYYKTGRKIQKGKTVDPETKKEYERLTKELNELPKEVRDVANEKIRRAEKLYTPKKVAKIGGGIVAFLAVKNIIRNVQYQRMVDAYMDSLG